MSGYLKGGEQNLCKITGHRAPLVWFSERTQDLSSGVPVLTSSSRTRHSTEWRQWVNQSSDLLHGTRSSRWGSLNSQPTRVSATAPGRGLGPLHFPQVAFAKCKTNIPAGLTGSVRRGQAQLQRCQNGRNWDDYNNSFQPKNRLLNIFFSFKSRCK